MALSEVELTAMREIAETAGRRDLPKDVLADLLADRDELAAEVERLRADNREMLVAIDKAYDDWEECDSPAYEELKRLVFKHWDALLALKAALRAAGLMEVSDGTV